MLLEKELNFKILISKFYSKLYEIKEKVARKSSKKKLK